MIHATARTEDDRSDSIVVSFDPAWRQKILDARFSIIIRKRVPVSVVPSWIYFHINAPFSEILARARIDAIKMISKHDAAKLHEKLDLSIGKISTYVGAASEIGAYLISEFEIASKSVTARALREQMIYSPPQSFLFLSHEGKALVDRLCKFRAPSRSKLG